jgi:hypothetical protein
MWSFLLKHLGVNFLTLLWKKKNQFKQIWIFTTMQWCSLMKRESKFRVGFHKIFCDNFTNTWCKDAKSTKNLAENVPITLTQRNTHPQNDGKMFTKCFLNTNLGCIIIALVGIQITFYGLLTIVLWLRVPFHRNEQDIFS